MPPSSSAGVDRLLALWFETLRPTLEALHDVAPEAQGLIEGLEPLVLQAAERLYDAATRAYEQAGAPYGPSGAGVLRWLDELRAAKIAEQAEDYAFDRRVLAEGLKREVG